MSVYLYSVSEAHLVGSLAWPPGVSEAPVVTLAVGTLALIGSEMEHLPPRVQRHDLERHDAVKPCHARNRRLRAPPFRYAAPLGCRVS